MGSTGSQSNQFNSQSSSVSSADYSSLVAQIIAALRPSIALSVQEALEASRVTTTQVTSVNQGGFNPNAFGSSGSSTSSSFQGSSSSSGSSSFSGSSSGSVSGQVLFLASLEMGRGTMSRLRPPSTTLSTTPSKC